MKIVIIGTRGIPNHYGGFEQFTEELGTGLVKNGHEVIVFNPRGHSYVEPDFNGVKIKRQKESLRFMPALSTLLYDYYCLKAALQLNPDILFSCGYSSALFLRLLKNPKKVPVIIHMDGMEWQREKWGWIASNFLKWNEKLAIQWSDKQIVDHPDIWEYFLTKYQVKTKYIPYGAHIVTTQTELERKKSKDLEFLDMGKEYFLVISRLEPENHIGMILQAWLNSKQNYLMVIVGDTGTKYGNFLIKKYSRFNDIYFLGSIFDKSALNPLRKNCKAYIHGHSVGGTNPSLLEAMAMSCFIFAHDNTYNRNVLGKNAIFFNSITMLADYFTSINKHMDYKEKFSKGNLIKIQKEYTWGKITKQYIDFFNSVINKTQQIPTRKVGLHQRLKS